MASCALDDRQLDVARRLADDARQLASSPYVDVTAGRLAFATGDTTTALLAAGQIRTVVLLDKVGGGTPQTYTILGDR